ncbi:MAG: hypothetical protein ABSF17_17570 [Terracidiphilus sp.]|jgi:hypothetical protein
MKPTQTQPRTLALVALSLPIGLFTAYLVYLVVPEILRVVVPAVVQTVAAR